MTLVTQRAIQMKGAIIGMYLWTRGSCLDGPKTAWKQDGHFGGWFLSSADEDDDSMMWVTCTA